ncbi:hypothetical protein AXF42_Ash014339 [Apostasia shenzhenica]|uniref:Uncharacterized protein n=1 Tax=Apostasia shenzhenica TaxID=1088818 RepID=A0A2I0B0U3_9ASPA|nr:hypothetical protein AXF42_Ash014339 [Apostasia shenzhenica]
MSLPARAMPMLDGVTYPNVGDGCQDVMWHSFRCFRSCQGSYVYVMKKRQL